MSQFYSQFGEDQWIMSNLQLPSRGVFVDIGAGDGVRYSNSLFFERLGWTGLLIEAVPALLPSLVANRCSIIESCAISLRDAQTFYVAGDTDLSGFLREQLGAPVDVTIERLETLLVKHAIDLIDLLTVDTEGTELDVLASMDLVKHRPRIVVIEYLTAHLGNNYDAVMETLSPYYSLRHRTECNLIFEWSRPH